ncbi:MAG: RecX family transcriptional regulator [Acidobacteria bacterium]|nr:RecX family transcriptional regulator [Acidobacteriota bacterium]
MADRTPRRPKPLDRAGLHDYALRLLGGRALSAGELRQRLARRAAMAEDVEEVLAQLKQRGYLNDQRFAESFAASRLANDRFGSARVIRDLRQRRVAPSLAEGTVRQVYEDVDESALIEEWIRRKYRAAPREGLFQDERELASAYRRLARAGFRTGEIVRALKKFARDPDLLDGFEPPEEEGE